MEKDLISIIVPCYNVEKWLPDLIRTIEQQTYKNFEAIFINDGSKDNTLNVLKSFAEGKKNFVVIDKKNQGQSSARNDGLAVAKGEFIYFCDADDMLSPNLLEMAHENLKNFDCVAFGSHWVKESFPLKKVKTDKSQKYKIFEDTENLLCNFFAGKLGYVIWNKLYRKEILEKFPNYPKVFNENSFYGEDIEFNSLYISNSKKFKKINSKLYYYRRRKGGEVRSKFNEKKLSVFNGINKAEEICLLNNYTTALKYVKARCAVSSLEMLLKIANCKYRDADQIKNLYKNLKSNAKYVFKARKNPKYLRYTVPLVVPFIKLMFFKYLKKKRV